MISTCDIGNRDFNYIKIVIILIVLGLLSLCALVSVNYVGIATDTIMLLAHNKQLLLVCAYVTRYWTVPFVLSRDLPRVASPFFVKLLLCQSSWCTPLCQVVAVNMIYN